MGVIMWQIKCKECGDETPASLWLENSLGVKFPAGHLQCPVCRVAVTRKQEQPEFFEYDGKEMIIPGKIKLVPAATI